MSSEKKALTIGAPLLIIGIIVYFLFLQPILFPATAPSKPDETLSPTVVTEQVKTYTNEKYGYSVSYPGTMNAYQFPDSQSGANFDGGIYVVDVSQKGGNPPYPSIDQYAKTAATMEIQNFQKLNSIKTVTTDSGLIGYQTTWIVGPPPMLNPPTDYQSQTSISAPITYFAVPNNDSLVLVFRINTDKVSEEQLKTYNEMIKTISFH